MKNSTDEWAGKLAQDLLRPDVFGTKVTIRRIEGGTYNRQVGEHVGGVAVDYVLNASPPINNDQELGGDDVTTEGSMQAWLAYKDLPFEIQEGMTVQYSWEGQTFIWVVTANRRAVSGFQGAGWRITGDL